MARVAAGVAAVVMALGVLGARPAAAQFGGQWLWNFYDKPWCLSAAEMDDCSYSTFRQCNIARSGTGGSCYPNPRYSYQPPQPRPRAKKRRSQG